MSSSGWYLDKEFPNHISLWRNKSISEIANTAETEPLQQQELKYVWGILPILFLSGAIVTNSIAVIQGS